MKNRKAFSLVEMLVVVAIIGIIALVAIPAFSRYYQLFKFRTTMNQFVNDIRAARQSAITSGNPVKITYITMSQYPEVKSISSGYAIYMLTSNDITGSGATLTNWREIAPGRNVCGTKAQKPRFIPYPAEILDGSSVLMDVDNDSVKDLVFMPDGSVFKGPYPASKSPFTASDCLTFNESPADPTVATPRIVMNTVATIAFNRYCIYLSLYGKISVYQYHHV